MLDISTYCGKPTRLSQAAFSGIMIREAAGASLLPEESGRWIMEEL